MRQPPVIRQTASQRELNQQFLDLAEFDRGNKEDARRFFTETMKNVPPCAGAELVRELKCATCGQSVFVSDAAVELTGECREEAMNPAFPAAGMMRIHSTRRR